MSKIKEENVREIIREIKHVPKNLKDWAIEDNKIMSVLKVGEIRHIICHTDKGDLALILEKDKTHRDYRFVLDAVKLGDEENDKLLKIFNGTIFTI